MVRVRRAVYIQIGVVALAMTSLVLLARSSPVVELIAATQRQVVDLGQWSAICYSVLFALCNILLLPGGILSVGAGFFFGLWWGFAVVFIGNGIGAAVSFGLSRWLGERWLRKKLLGTSTLASLESAVAREGWKIIVLSQLHPLFPTSLLNYLYGLTRIRFRTYLLWASVGRAPGLFLYAYVGTLGQLGLNLARGKTHPRIVEYWTWGGAFVVTGLILLILSRIARRTVEKTPEAWITEGEPAPKPRRIPQSITQ